MTAPGLRKRRRWAAIIALAAGCLMAGIVALTLRGDDSAVACSEKPSTPPLSAPGGRHPSQTFYAPGEEVPRGDLAHGISHGYLVVTYQPGLSQSEQDALADWAVTSDFVVVAPADEKQKETVRADTARRRLSCVEMDVNALTGFRDRWFKSAGLSR